MQTHIHPYTKREVIWRQMGLRPSCYLHIECMQLMNQNLLKPTHSLDCCEFIFYTHSQWMKLGRQNKARFSTYLSQQSKQHICAQGTLMSLIHNNGTVVVQIWLSKGLPQKNTISHVFYHCFLFQKTYQAIRLCKLPWKYPFSKWCNLNLWFLLVWKKINIYCPSQIPETVISMYIVLKMMYKYMYTGINEQINIDWVCYQLLFWMPEFDSLNVCSDILLQLVFLTVFQQYMP